MVLITTVRNILIAGILVSVAACGSSDSNDNPEPQDAENAENAENTENTENTESSDSQTPPVVDDAEEQRPQNGEVETSESIDNESSNSPPEDSSGESGSDTPPALVDGIPPIPPFPPLPDNVEEVVIEDASMDPPDVTEAPLPPPVLPGSDLDRLIKGMTRQASITLLDLNRRLTQGEDISETQNKCLGTYEPSEGNSLLQIDCGERTGANGEVLLGGNDKPKLEYLATGEIPIYVNSTAFYNTAECSSALFNQSTGNCVLETMSLMIRSTLSGLAPPPAPGSPGHQANLNFPGAIIEYAIGDTSIRINNLFPPINGIFSCDIDIDTKAQTDSVITGSCPALIKQMADQIELLQGE